MASITCICICICVCEFVFVFVYLYLYLCNCLDHLQRVPQRGPDVLHNFDLVACAEVFHSIVSFQPVSLAVLVEADPDHVEVLAQLGEHLHRLAQHHVQGSTALGEGLVQVLQALQQELHLVELAKPEKDLCDSVFQQFQVLTWWLAFPHQI